MQKLSRFMLGTSLAVAALAIHAQPAPSAGTPENVGVSQGTAAEAATKAVPRNDTGTLVRTSPSAADKARAAADDVSSRTTTTTTTTDAAPVRRARKADRN